MFQSLFISFLLLIFLLTPFNPAFALRTQDYSKQSLIEADFSNEDLHGVTFNLANLLKANFSDSNLEGASLFRVKLQEANLTNSNLRGATLDSAILEGTNLKNANLEDSFAFDTKFQDVKIKGADFTNVILANDQLKVLCPIADGINTVTGRYTKETLGCS